jgi:signal transduction histidine kinase
MRWRSVRLRLALLYGLVALAAGLSVFLVLREGADRAVDAVLFDLPLPNTSDDTPVSGDLVDPKSARIEREEEIRADLRRQLLATFDRWGAMSLAGLTVAGLALGGFAGHRALRPLTAITAATRRIAERNLHERIPATGPDDEWQDLRNAVNTMLSRLDTAFAAQRQFVGNASHELKTPLAINRTLLEVAMERTDASPDLMRLGENLLDVTVRHERLVDGLLTLAAAEHRITTAHRIDLAEVVGDAVRLLRPEAERRRLRVTAEMNGVEIDGNPLLLDRLAQNLVQNAIVHNVQDGWVRVELGPTATGARLVVSNTGDVIPAASVPMLFEPFQRVANRVRSTKGTGLGLTIVRSVVHAHAGEVVARPRDGGGLEIEVVLPAVVK